MPNLYFIYFRRYGLNTLWNHCGVLWGSVLSLSGFFLRSSLQKLFKEFHFKGFSKILVGCH